MARKVVLDVMLGRPRLTLLPNLHPVRRTLSSTTACGFSDCRPLPRLSVGLMLLIVFPVLTDRVVRLSTLVELGLLVLEESVDLRRGLKQSLPLCDRKRHCD